MNGMGVIDFNHKLKVCYIFFIGKEDVTSAYLGSVRVGDIDSHGRFHMDVGQDNICTN